MYKIEELQKKTEKELLKLISELKGKLLALRFENATGQLTESHLIKSTKKDIAKIFTILRDRSYSSETNKKKKKAENKKIAKEKEVAKEVKDQPTTKIEDKPKIEDKIEENISETKGDK